MAEKSKEFGVRLKELMRKEGFTQNILAEKLKIHQTAISNYIRKGVIPEAPILYKLAKEFNISMEELLVGKKDKDSPVNNLRRIDDYLTREDERYSTAKNNLDLIFKSKYDDVKKAIVSNLEVFAGTVNDREGPVMKRKTPGK